MSWIFQGEKINSLNDIPEEFKDSFGFVYNIVCSNGKEYIGQKRLFTERSKVASQKQVRQKGKSYFRRKTIKSGKKKGEIKYYETIRKESNWVSYTGSSKKLTEDIKKNGVTFTKYILCFCKDKTMLNYQETKHILCTGAMEEEKFYNDYTQIKVFKKNIINRNK